ncbi:glycosyltransferase family 2 protein [Campylobacter vulpis]|uniref:Glucosyltransferase n=1 Tax=Campylobacter vulpis TaxID=1655500 RepID=A0A2G4R3A0_9BACT|nr:glycosyltransferase family A protein [Campylobacter vulpis]MBS4251834.1 glycosyltransferase family 2 protein [Campylobacter vulpis]MBS4281205.1 glycosyltransferase family 2 protein [Campylobacter vulpis]MBS4331044.1 glycosyltransferase family 2 protein [Campylobacter vulpis]MBS4438643.1 glycosyltransferase family 2 protein [Campylobacter vulpis]PHY91044.1 glucosyltransferase [Campylobacter vulpis]
MTIFSIIIPLYNCEKWICRALKSCQNQDFKNFEVLIIDDKSEDESIKVVLEFIKNDKRFKLFCNASHLGTFASRNEGILRASSPFLMFLDSDDFLCEGALKRAFESLNLKADLVLFDAFVHRVKTKLFYRFKQDEILNQGEFFDFLGKQRHFCWSLWAKVFRRDLALKCFEFVDKKACLCYGEDVLFCYVYFMLCEKIAIVKHSIYRYEFNAFGRYESKDREILRQNYEDKTTSLKLIKNIAKNFPPNSLNERLFSHLEKESLDLKKRYLKSIKKEKVELIQISELLDR